MKKIISILICLMLAVSCTAALGEENGKVSIGVISINGAFDLQCGVPEGYSIVPLESNGSQVLATLISEDPEKPVMQLSVAFDETYADVERMNDLSDEEFAILEKTFTDLDPTVEISYGDTGLGTRLMIARQSDENQVNYIAFLSIYKGYFVEFVLTPSQTASSRILTDEQLMVCIDFLTDMDFVPAALPNDDISRISNQTWITNLTDYNPETGTVHASVLRADLLEADLVETLVPGDTLSFGNEEVTVETIEPESDGEYLVNGTITLSRYGEEYHVFYGEREYLYEFASLDLTVGENVEFLDDIDPETGEMADETTVHSAKEFAAMLENETAPGFASENVFVSYNGNGEMALVQRFYVPWQ